MRRIVLSILFLWAVVWSWNTIVRHIVPAEELPVVEREAEGEVRQTTDQMIRVSFEANRCADISVRPVNPLPTYPVRRYRPGVFSLGYLFGCSGRAADLNVHPVKKNFLELSQCCASRLKDKGYYVYTLRKIIV